MDGFNIKPKSPKKKAEVIEKTTSAPIDGEKKEVEKPIEKVTENKEENKPQTVKKNDPCKDCKAYKRSSYKACRSCVEYKKI